MIDLAFCSPIDYMYVCKGSDEESCEDRCSCFWNNQTNVCEDLKGQDTNKCPEMKVFYYIVIVAMIISVCLCVSIFVGYLIHLVREKLKKKDYIPLE